MLFILALLFFPCALVGAFVTADECDLTAFQTSGLFSGSTHSLGGAGGGLCERSEARAAKDAVPPARRPSPCAMRRDRAPVVTVSLVCLLTVRIFEYFVRGSRHRYGQEELPVRLYVRVDLGYHY